MIEVCEPKKWLHLFLGLGHRPFCNPCNFDWIHCDWPMCDYKSKVFNLCALEFTFVMLQEELMFIKLFQDQTCNDIVLLHGFGIDEDFIKVHTDHSLHDEVLKDLIHHCLKGRRTVCKAKEHHQWFKHPTTCLKCSLPFITFLHSHILIPPSHIQFCEVLGTTKLVDKVRNERKWVVILDCYCIESVIVLDEA